MSTFDNSDISENNPEEKYSLYNKNLKRNT